MTVYKGYMKIIWQNRGLILMYLGIFFALTIMFQFMVKGNEYTDYQAESVKIALVDEAGGELALGLKEYLEQFHNVTIKENDTAALQEDLFYRNIEYVVRIPENFFETCIVNGEKLKVTKVPGSYTAYYLDQQINSYLNDARTCYAAGFSEEEIAEAIRELEAPDVKMLNFSGTAGEMPAYAYYFRYIPYLFLSVFCYALGNVLSAFRKGDLPKRMKASAVSARRQNLEGLLAAFTIGAVIWGITIVVAFVMHQKTLLESTGVIYYILNSAVMLLVALALSYLVGIVTKNNNQLSGIVNVLSLGMCFLCGVFVPLEIMNKNVIKVAQFLPVYWYEKVNDLLVDFGTITGETRNLILQYMGIQLVFVIAFVCIALAASKARTEG